MMLVTGGAPGRASARAIDPLESTIAMGKIIFGGVMERQFEFFVPELREKVRLGDLVALETRPELSAITRKDQRYSQRINWEYIGTDRMKQAFIKDPKAGTFAELVQAAVLALEAELQPVPGSLLDLVRGGHPPDFVHGGQSTLHLGDAVDKDELLLDLFRIGMKLGQAVALPDNREVKGVHVAKIVEHQRCSRVGGQLSLDLGDLGPELLEPLVKGRAGLCGRSSPA